jgi:hypothetical protein
MVDVPSEVPYTPKLLALTFMGQCDKDPADRYKTLLGREEAISLAKPPWQQPCRKTLLPRWSAIL